MIRSIRMFPPLLALAVASLLAQPAPTRAESDAVARALHAAVPASAFVGRTLAGLGYVLVSITRPSSSCRRGAAA